MITSITDQNLIVKRELPSLYVSAIYVFENFEIFEEDLSFVDKSVSDRRNFWLYDKEQESLIGYASTKLIDLNRILDQIEIRRERREEGLSKLLVDKLEEILETKLYVDGHYTVDGLTLWKRIPMLEGSKVKIVSDSDSFVEDWEKMLSAF